MKSMVFPGGMRAHTPSAGSSSPSQGSARDRRGRRRKTLLKKLKLVEEGDGKEPTSVPGELSREADIHDRAWVESQPLRVFLREWMAGFRWVNRLRNEGLRLPDASIDLFWNTYATIHGRLQRANLYAVQMTHEEREVMRMMLELRSEVPGLRHAFSQGRVFPADLIQPYVKLVLGTRWPDFVLIGVGVDGCRVPGRKKDFCALIIEIDGDCHLNPGKEKKDEELFAKAADLGILVMRFTNDTVNDRPNVVRSFLRTLRPAPPAGSDRVMANVIASTLAVQLTVHELEQVLRDDGILVDLERAYRRYRSDSNLKSQEFTAAVVAVNALEEEIRSEVVEEVRSTRSRRRRPSKKPTRPEVFIRRASRCDRSAS
jgi:Protein of unknown function (DUF559)